MGLRVQTIQWTGNGAVGDRLIATLFALNVGHTVVLVFPSSVGRSSLWRNSAASPAGTRDMQDPSNHKSATGGVVALQSGGFTVNNDTGVSPNINANETGIAYTAVVLNDIAGDEMRVGQFSGNASTQSIASGLSALSDVWIVGGAGGIIGTGTAYRSSLYTGNSSTPFGAGGQTTNQITGFTGGTFDVNFVNISGTINGSPGGVPGLYEWLAFNLPANSYKVQHFYDNGTASATITHTFTGLYDLIQICCGRATNLAAGPIWRGPNEAGTNSWLFNGTAVISGGIEAKGATSVTLGHSFAPNGIAGAGLIFPGIAGLPPVISSLSPTHGTAAGGTTVTINGNYFVSGCIVNFDNVAATDVTFISTTQITCKTPAHAAGLVNVTVTNPDFLKDTSVNAYTFEGQITSVTPNHGTLVGGTHVTIAGAGFINGSTITFGGVPATDVVFVDVNTFTCVTPQHAIGAVDVVITEP
jgi:hypothetical protein